MWEKRYKTKFVAAREESWRGRCSSYLMFCANYPQIQGSKFCESGVWGVRFGSGCSPMLAGAMVI